MKASVLLGLVTAVVLVVAGSPAFAQERVALVVGNAKYSHAPELANTLNDASAIAAKFEKLGFDVSLLSDQSFSGLRKGLSDFRRKASRAKVAVVFYAGHGIEVDKQNYIVPVDAELRTDADVEFEAIPLDLVLRSVSGAQRFRLVILDACRDNPFLRTMERQVATRSIGRGLARVEPTGETLVAFAAKEGTTASDGTGPHSPYTEALLAQLEQPGLEIGLLFRKVRDAVVAATGGEQEPFTYGSLSSREFYFSDPDTGGTTEPTGPVAGDDSAEDALWKAVEASGTLDAYKSYLERFPAGKYAFAAQIWIKSLTPKDDEPEEIDVANTTPDTTEQDLDTSSGSDTVYQAENPPILRCDRLAADPSDAARVVTGVHWHDLDAKAAVRACRKDIASYPKAKRLTYQLARALHRGGDISEAKESYEALSDDGYAAAQDKLGVLYTRGPGVRKDHAKALGLFEAAAETGNVDAVFHLGYMYHQGNGVRRNYTKARELYESAAGSGQPSAMVNLGLFYTKGLGVRTNHNRALEYYRQAAEHDHPIALTNIGHMYRDGRAVRRNYGEALSYLERGADNGASEAMYSLAVMTHQGQGKRPSYTEAARWMFKALKHGNELALREMTNNARAWNAQFRRALQIEMRDEGHYSGAIDGQFGPGTQRALTALARGNSA